MPQAGGGSEQSQQQGQNTQNIDVIFVRLVNVEKGIRDLQEQLKMYVPARENDLQTKSIFESVQRIEKDVQEAKAKLIDVNEKVNTIDRNAEKRESAIQIRVLAGTLTFLIGGAISVFVGYITHLFH